MFRVNLFNAKLNRAKLIQTNLSYGNLCYADLRQADLRQANLSAAWCKHAKFEGSDLSFADLSGAIFSYADLKDATMEGAEFNTTVLGYTNLSGVKGLESCVHWNPSIIDFHTLTMSGSLPINFQRGCGMPENLITYLSSLKADAIEFYSCFISYSSKDQVFAERLHADLQNREVRCWFAPEDLKIGDRFRDQIDQSIRLHDKLLIILSENSVASPWVNDEVEAAIEREHREGRIVLFPIKIDEAVTESDKAWAATIRRTRHIGAFTDWKDHESYQKAFERLLRDLKAEETKP